MKNEWLELGPNIPIRQESNGRIRYVVTTTYDSTYQYRVWWDGSFWFCKDTLSTFSDSEIINFKVAGHRDKTGPINP